MRPWWWKIAAGVFLAGGFAVVLAVSAEALLAFGRPPQPLPFGTVQWLDEVGATVDSVDRVPRIGSGRNAIRAKGEFYIVHARILAPFGLRPTWDDNDVEVWTFSGSGGTMRDRRFTIDERAQATLDRVTHRPGPRHLVRGAEQREDLVFDLPADVEQPGLLFLPANAPIGLAYIVFGRFWGPHRFNLRYD
jgi:hypothetical protein